MKRLLLFRHAKAVAESPKSGDHARVLSERGRRDAARMGIAMQHRSYLADLVLCSTAERTRETWKHASAEMERAPAIRFLDALYLAPWKTIAALVREGGGDAPSVLVLAHNPGLEDCARLLTREPHTPQERRLHSLLREKFPTGALAVCDFEIEDWQQMPAGAAELADFIRPRDLSDD
jgi:phosphohistidine phosphatase